MDEKAVQEAIAAGIAQATASEPMITPESFFTWAVLLGLAALLGLVARQQREIKVQLGAITVLCQWSKDEHEDEESGFGNKHVLENQKTMMEIQDSMLGQFKDALKVKRYMRKQLDYVVEKSGASELERLAMEDPSGE